MASQNTRQLFRRLTQENQHQRYSRAHNTVLHQQVPRQSIDHSSQLNQYNRLSDIYTKERPADDSNDPHSRKLLKHMLSRLESRGEAFYKMGFRSFERQNNLHCLEEILNLKLNQTKGTMSVGELWTNKNMIKYLKANQMFLNKKQLLIELKLLEKEEAKNKKNAMIFTSHDLKSNKQINPRSKQQKTVSQGSQFSIDGDETPGAKYPARTRKMKAPEVSDQDLEFRRKTNFQLAILQQKLAKLSVESFNKITRDAAFAGLQKSTEKFAKLQKVYNNKLIDFL